MDFQVLAFKIGLPLLVCLIRGYGGLHIKNQFPWFPVSSLKLPNLSSKVSEP